MPESALKVPGFVFSNHYLMTPLYVSLLNNFIKKHKKTGT